MAKLASRVSSSITKSLTDTRGVAVGLSLSMMVAVVSVSPISAFALGADSCSLRVSTPSRVASLLITKGTVSSVTFASNVRVPLAAVKSEPPVAVCASSDQLTVIGVALGSLSQTTNCVGSEFSSPTVARRT
ncbi:hypothetical protein D3C78_1455620 [compost metagenome]